MTKTISILLLSVVCFFAKAQTETDTIKKHSPHKAAILSAILPGAGQVYNKKYWKTPIVWAALGTTVYFAIDNSKIYNGLRDEYIARLNGKQFNVASVCDLRNPEFCSTKIITDTLDHFRRRRDIYIIATSAVYVLQTIDAAVDAHLFHFDVSDDLSFFWTPNVYFIDPNSNKSTFGLALQLQF